MAFLDETGFSHFWSRLEVMLGKKADTTMIPTIPSSLPANGGNADTVDGKHIVVTSTAPTSNDTSKITIVI